MDSEKFEKIDSRIVELYRKPKSELKAIVEQTHKIVDLRDVDKHVLVSMIAEAEFGRKTMEKFTNFEGEE